MEKWSRLADSRWRQSRHAVVVSNACYTHRRDDSTGGLEAKVILLDERADVEAVAEEAGRCGSHVKGCSVAEIRIGSCRTNTNTNASIRTSANASNTRNTSNTSTRASTGTSATVNAGQFGSIMFDKASAQEAGDAAEVLTKIAMVANPANLQTGFYSQFVELIIPMYGTILGARRHQLADRDALADLSYQSIKLDDVASDFGSADIFVRMGLRKAEDTEDIHKVYINLKNFI